MKNLLTENTGSEARGLLEPATLFTVGALPLPFTGGMSLFVVGYGLLLAGCVLVGAGLAVWRKVNGR
ncbi:MAG: hypothetical protein LC118_13190 [Dehalococcoidia bacterium]|nr:hypothetical protein [Dehalococcoidia bacterium]